MISGLPTGEMFERQEFSGLEQLFEVGRGDDGGLEIKAFNLNEFAEPR